ncbi:hypothetical protein NFI96_027473 [Prochilodus magdalenae]|nr:hypothetical protein NFI96_027473 [Prochilodus magdalenae]
MHLRMSTGLGLPSGVYSVSPLDTEKQVSVGDSVTLSLRYSTSDVYRIHWYHQYPPFNLDLILSVYESGGVSGSPPPRFSAKVQNKQVDLEISSAAVSDSVLRCTEPDCVKRFCGSVWGSCQVFLSFSAKYEKCG